MLLAKDKHKKWPVLRSSDVDDVLGTVDATAVPPDAGGASVVEVISAVMGLGRDRPVEETVVVP